MPKIDLIKKILRSVFPSYRVALKIEKKLYEIEKINQDYSITNFIWRSEGSTKQLLTQLEFWSQSPYLWEKANNNLWLIYISALYENKKNKKAQEILRKYIHYHGQKDIEKYLLIAKFASLQGVTNKEIAQAAFIFEKLEENRKNKIFENILAGKTIAIVGNGPSEIGKGNGAVIDSHDIVIRFNNYLTEGFEKDYGTKTDIWVRGGGTDVKDRLNIKAYKLVIWEIDYWHYTARPECRFILFRDISNFPDSIYNFSYEMHLSLKTQSLIPFPTTGLKTIWAIYNNLNICTDVNVYGFSFQQKVLEEHTSHYFNDRSVEESKIRSSVHDIYSEAIFFKGFLEKRLNKHLQSL